MSVATEAVGAVADALETTEAVVPVIDKAAAAAASLEQSAVVGPNQALKDLAEGGPSDWDMKKMAESDGSLSPEEFKKTEAGEKERATKTANECLTSATDSVRADILKGMAKDGEPVKVDASGWPVDGIQKVKVLDAMEKRQGEIEDNALKAAVAERLGPIPKDPQEQRTWRENYKKGVDAALDAKKEVKGANSAKATEATPAASEAAPSATAKGSEAAAATPEAKGEKKESAERQNTLASAFKDAKDYLLASSKNTQKNGASAKASPPAPAAEGAGAQLKEKNSGAQTKEDIMDAVDKFSKTKEGEGYKKKFIFALVSLTAILGIALESADNLNQQAQAEMQRSNQAGRPAGA